MNGPVRFFAIAVIAGSAQVSAQQIDFDFSGTVEQAGGWLSTVPLGSNVSGSFTIDLGNASDPACFVAPVADRFICEAASGTSVPGSVPTNYVITFVVNLDGFTYRSTDFPHGVYESLTAVETASGIQFNGSTHYWWNGTERQIQEELPTDNVSQATLNLYNRDSRPNTNTGYPVFSGATFGRGLVCSRLGGPGTGGCVAYDITSITPVDQIPVYVAPAPATGSGGGLMSLGFLAALLTISVFRLAKRRSRIL